MATRLLVLKILFLVLIARHSLLFAEALEEDEALEGEFNKANNESTIIEAASTIYAENEPATTSDPSETRQPNETEVPEASTTKLLINESIEKRAGDSRAETTDKPALIAELGLSTTLNLAAPQEAAATTASSLLAGSTAPPPPPMSQAELCYLSNGGSSLTLTVNEATEVGSIIGTIEVSKSRQLEDNEVFGCEIESRTRASAGRLGSLLRVEERCVAASQCPMTVIGQFSCRGWMIESESERVNKSSSWIGPRGLICDTRSERGPLITGCH